MPDHGDGARFVQRRRTAQRFGVRRQRLPVTALMQADGPKLALADGDLTRLPSCSAAPDALFVGRCRFVEPTHVQRQSPCSVKQTVAIPPAASPGVRLAMASKRWRPRPAGRRLFRAAGPLQHAGHEKCSHRQIVIGVGIRLHARRPGAHEQRLAALERLTEPPVSSAGRCGCPLPRIVCESSRRPHRRRGVADLPHRASSRGLPSACSRL